VLVPLVFFSFAGWYMTSMPGKSFRGKLPGLTAEEAALAARLRGHVEKLAGEIGDRSACCPKALERARLYVEEQFRARGYQPGLHEYVADRQKFANVVAELPGADAGAGIVVVGAHYDTCDNPGANDNASGVAALLELAGRFHSRQMRSPVRFAAFANEEPPFFQTEGMGSMAYARMLKSRGERVSAMLALETLGCYSDQPGSQKYPGLVGWFYPDRGNFVAFVGDLGSRSLLRRCTSAFRRSAQFPSEGACLPGWIPGIGWSDHWSFRQAGYPAIMVTDTAPFRYPHYHREEDTPDKLDYERLARVVSGLAGVVEELAR
jgi:Zn-dependent M28 family amino/carboxypeptidase